MARQKVSHINKTHRKAAKGFTLVEVMLVLGLTALLLLGTLGGTFGAISSQRYNDSVRSLAEYLRTIYGEVISPESFNADSSGRDKQAILGKILVFGADRSHPDDDNRMIYSATLVGNASLNELNSLDDGTVLDELKRLNIQAYCGDSSNASTVESYLPTWGAELRMPDGKGKSNPKFTGALLIVRAPSSNVVHTYFNVDGDYDLESNCGGVGNRIRNDIESGKFKTEKVGICVQSNNANLFQEVSIAEDGRNTSAISILNTDVDENGEKSKCQ